MFNFLPFFNVILLVVEHFAFDKIVGKFLQIVRLSIDCIENDSK